MRFRYDVLINVVVFLDNDTESGQEHWDMVEANERAEQMVIYLPKVATLYREIYLFVGRSNQQLSYYNIEFPCVRKQSRIFDSLCKMYALVKRHTLWRNSLNITANLTRDAKSQNAFRFEVIRIWYAKFKMTNGRVDVLHYPTIKLQTKKTPLETTLSSPRKGHHEVQRITAGETASKERRLKCRICHKKTSFKRQKCSSSGDTLALCSYQTGRDCWNKHQVAREFDVPSSQSQKDIEP